MSNVVCNKRKAKFFIGGRKKFGGGSESECGMTQFRNSMILPELLDDL